MSLMVVAMVGCKDTTTDPPAETPDLLLQQVMKRNGNEAPTGPLAEGNNVVFSGTFSDAAGTHTDYAFRRYSSSGSLLLGWLVGMPNTTNDAYRLKKRAAGGYLILGSTSGAGKDAQAVFTNVDGNYEHELVTGGSADDVFTDAVELSDGSFLVCGTTNSSGPAARNIYLVKMSSTGGKVWEKTFGTNGNDGASAILPFGDGYAIYGYTDGAGAGDRDLCVLKVTASGDSLWMKTYGGDKYEQSGGMIATKDGNYVLCGHTTSFGDPMHDAYVVKIDADGDQLWSKTYGRENHDGADAIIELKNGDLAMTGYSRIPDLTDNELYFLHVSASGKKLRELRYGFPNSNEAGMGLAELADGIMVVGQTEAAGVTDVYLVKLSR